MSASPRSTNALWAWNVRHSPIARRVRAHRYVQPLLDASTLNKPVQQRIDTIVKRTRLWADERADVARELIAHAQDAAADDQPEPAILESLGDPRPIAKLIRRATKRKRGLLYQSRLWCTRALGASVLLLVFAYAALTIRFYAGSPNIRINHLAELNAPRAAYAPDQWAAPAVRETRLAWTNLHTPILQAQKERALDRGSTANESTEYAGLERLHDLPESHPDFAETRDLVVSFRPHLDALAAALRRPVLGTLYSDRYEQQEDPSPVLNMLPPAEDPADQEWIIGVLLPDLGSHRTLARLLAFDARLAADERDADRATQSLGAMADIARLGAQEPFLISNIVAFAVLELTCVETLRAIHDHPALFDERDIAELSHRLAAARSNLTLDFDSERRLFDDLLQRGFTDDGRGDGRITPEGLAMLDQATGVSDDHDFYTNFYNYPGRWNLASRVTAPSSQVMIASRAELRAVYDDMHDLTNRALHEGPTALAWYDAEWAARMEQLSPLERTRIAPVRAIMPALGQAIESLARTQARVHATLAALALHAAHTRDGAFPPTLESITPELLADLPTDPFDPGNTIRYRLDPESGFVLYYTGTDGDDDAGKQPTNPNDRADSLSMRYANYNARPAAIQDQGRPAALSNSYLPDPAHVPDADWVIYPPRLD